MFHVVLAVLTDNSSKTTSSNNHEHLTQ